jgi:hypothetical protein
VDFTTASFLYATLKCHEIMEGYVKHQFHAHPHVSSVITRHLAANFVKPEESQSSKQAALDAKVTALASKVDSYVSRVDAYITREKEKVKTDITDPFKPQKSKKYKAKNEAGDS